MGNTHRVRSFFAKAVIVAFAIAATAAHAAQDWTLVDIGTLGGPGSYGAAVTDTGLVVGCADTATGSAHAFIYLAGMMHDLGTGSDSPAGDSCALAVNSWGLVAGRSSTGELVIWNWRGVTHLGIKGNVGGMNDAGVVVGTRVDGGSSRAFVYMEGRLTTLGTLDDSDPYASSGANAINERRQVVGASNGHAFLYERGVMRDLGTLGGSTSVARGINDRGEVVGMATDPYGAPTPFIFRGTMMQALPGPSYSSAIAINNRGQVVGSGEGVFGYLIEGDEVTYLSRLPAVVAKGWRRLEPTGINDRGWIVGTASNAEGDLRAFLLIPGDERWEKPRRF